LQNYRELHEYKNKHRFIVKVITWNIQISVSIHILSLLVTKNVPVSSQYIVNRIDSNATLARKLCLNF